MVFAPAMNYKCGNKSVMDSVEKLKSMDKIIVNPAVDIS